MSRIRASPFSEPSKNPACNAISGCSLFVQHFCGKSCQKSGKTPKCNFSDNIFAKKVVKKVEWQGFAVFVLRVFSVHLRKISFNILPDMKSTANTNGVSRSNVQIRMKTGICGHVMSTVSSEVLRKNMPLKSQ